MTAPFEPKGAWTALVTPFDAKGKLDEARFKRLVEFQAASGVTGVLPCGTTGESPTLDWEEQAALVRAAVKAAGDKVGVLAGTGSNSTAEAIAGTRDAKTNGASAVLLVDCYYNGPSSLELRTEYYERVLEAVPEIPIVPYVIPGRTGCALAPADVAHLHLADPARVPAVKEATGDLKRMAEERSLAGPELGILSGDDDKTLAMMQDDEIHAAGVISVMTNLVPGAIVSMVSAQANGDAAAAGALAAKLSPLFKLVGCTATSSRILPNGDEVVVTDKFRNPLPLKTIMAGLGLIDGLCRPPLGKMTGPAVAECRNAARLVWRESPELLKPIADAFDVDVDKRLGDDDIWSQLVA